MFLFYWIGAGIHALPWAALPETELVQAGFEQATYGLLSFVFGATCLAPVLARRLIAEQTVLPGAARSLGRLYLLIGVISYFILMPLLGRLPSMSAVLSVGTQLLITGMCLLCWDAKGLGSMSVFKVLGLATVFLPMTTMANAGFLGYGVLAAALVWTFVASFYRPRILLVTVVVAAAYGGLSFYVAYMKTRDDLRRVVWGGDALSARITQVLTIKDVLEPFDWTKSDHLEPVDGRLNQNGLVGAAVFHLNMTGDFEKGKTLWYAFAAMIPRAIWPDKPMKAGSMGMAAAFTGRTFAAGTSVGIGPVMESYANFSTPGVVIVFLVLGTALRLIDQRAYTHLESGDYHHFMRFHLVGCALVNVSGSFIEVASGAAAAVVASVLVQTILEKHSASRFPSKSIYRVESA
jgi:hypothetical protein